MSHCSTLLRSYSTSLVLYDLYSLLLLFTLLLSTLGYPLTLHAREELENQDGAALGSSSNKRNFYFESVLSWQEKLHGPADIADYIRNKRSA